MSWNSYKLPDGPKLNLGCGTIQPSGWINIDGSNRAYLASKVGWLDKVLVKIGILPPTEFSPKTKYCDVLKGLPYPDNSISCIYAGELWEHFEYNDSLRVTKDCFRVLKYGGVLRVCVPDGQKFWQDYLNLYQRESEKPRGEQNAKVLKEHIQLFFNDVCTKKVYLGSMGHFHKWLFDEIQLIDLFEQSGFVEVERMEFHSSRIPGIQHVEGSDFLIVEGIKR